MALGDIHPQINQFTLTGANLIWRGSGGAAAAAGYSVISSTNLSEPLTKWTVVATGIFDTNGDFTLTNDLSPPYPQQFFAVRIH